MEILFNNELDITDAWLDYVEQEVHVLIEHENILRMELYIDTQVLNPSMQQYLEKNGQMFEPVLGIYDREEESISVTAAALKILDSIPNLSRFKNLKSRIREVFCQVIRGLKGLKWKEIIKGVLVALIPAFSDGIPTVVLPIVIGLIAIFFKMGYGAVCNSRW